MLVIKKADFSKEDVEEIYFLRYKPLPNTGWM
jgi:hypothetical protein